MNAAQQALHTALANRQFDEAARLIVGFCLQAENYAAAEAECLALAAHTDATLRGNAILGLGHLARLHQRTSPTATVTIRHALRDPEAYVRGQAHAAADDLNQFTGAGIETDG